ncbi:hypothetical protein BH10BAC3_BH10BAC3_29880 [soil metagenome]
MRQLFLFKMMGPQSQDLLTKACFAVRNMYAGLRLSR